MEDIVQEDLEDLPEELEEIYAAETDRQNALDDRTFENYCLFNWPFKVTDLDSYDEEELYTMERGANILGHAVHRVLLTKYPKEKPAFSPDIPPVNIAVCIDDISDVTIMPVLQTLLQEKGVKLIEIQEAVNYCLERYKDETTMEYDGALIDETEEALENLGVKRSKKKKDKSDKGKGNKDKRGRKRRGNQNLQSLKRRVMKKFRLK